LLTHWNVTKVGTLFVFLCSELFMFLLSYSRIFIDVVDKYITNVFNFLKLRI